ncbi:MAG: ATP-dependent helicase UvrD/PcrA [Clostridiales bacterium]|nr:ATP-dependent helicase UvrD/PcrA [Clostridiales bacterium]MDN5281045.1 ATP-dependent helicase UvrD/PcrA [Candidatus Ozemobacter sp.]
MFESIDNTLNLLNERQRQAVEITEGPLLVVAGAGSGKTKMLTVRIAYLVEKCGVSPDSILAVTFTNKAAREMRERVQNLVSGAEKITLTTFHSFCCLLLRKWHKHAGFEDGFTIYDASDSEKLMKSVLKGKNVDPKKLSAKNVLNLISQAKNELVGPQEYRNFAGGSTSLGEKVQGIYEDYQNALMQNQAMDFDDLIFKAYLMLKDNPELLQRLQNQYRYFMVDEYQDTNHAQYRLVSLMSSATRNLCVVGDEDQSIYSWRGATIRNIQDFEKDFHGAKVVKLEQNYRSTQNILDAAGEVIARNVSAHPKKLWTDKSGGELLTFNRARDDRDEAEWVVGRIMTLVNQGFSYSDFAVLFRMNSLSRSIEQVLQKYNIPYEMTGGTKFFDRREVKDILAYLRAIENLKDSISLERIINTPRRGIGPGTIDKLCQGGLIPLWEGIAADGSANPNSKVGKFFTKMIDFLEASEYLKVSQLCKKIIEDIDYIDYLKKDDPETAQDRENNVQALVSDIRYQEEDNPNLTLSEYLASAALHSDQDDIHEEQQKVHLLTLHNAKGLEFPVVFLMGMEEGIFPHHSSKDAPEELEEERRLAYVGMTRAKERLFLTASNRRMMFGSWGANPVSRFVTEVPMHLYAGSSSITPSRSSQAREGFATSRSAIPGAISSKVVSRGPTFNSGAKWAPERKKAKELDDSTGTEAGTMINLKPGVRVNHDIFGHGTVMSTEGASLSDFRVTIGFEKKGRKTLLLQYANLQVIK